MNSNSARRPNQAVSAFSVFAASVLAVLAPWAFAEGPPPDSFAAAAEPSAEHATLEALAGEFDLTSTFWVDPAAPPEVTRLRARREVGLGGRVLRLEVGADENGFRGTGLMGYDNIAGRYWYVWTDTSTTGVSFLTGDVDERGAGTIEGHTPTPFGSTPLRVEIRFEHELEIHDYYVPAGDGGDEARMLELRYRRRG